MIKGGKPLLLYTYSLNALIISCYRFLSFSVNHCYEGCILKMRCFSPTLDVWIANYLMMVCASSDILVEAVSSSLSQFFLPARMRKLYFIPIYSKQFISSCLFEVSFSALAYKLLSFRGDCHFLLPIHASGSFEDLGFQSSFLISTLELS